MTLRRVVFPQPEGAEDDGDAPLLEGEAYSVEHGLAAEGFLEPGESIGHGKPPCPR